MVELTVIVALNYLDRGVERCGHIREKMRENTKGVVLEAKGKGPGVASAIINNDEVILIAAQTNNWGCPEITMC